MRKLTLLSAVLLTLTNVVSAQTLFTYGKYSVDKKDFVRIYEKNAINKKPDYSQAALNEYLELYSLFRMKVKEAELQKLDTVLSIQHELDNYRKQLAKNYLTDEEVNKKLIEEAYERTKENIQVSHILIMSSPMAPSKDTVEPYRIIDSVYHAIVDKKASFSKLAEKYSADKQSRPNGGMLGYITALQTLYEFENVAYNTPVGKVSKPFKTQYGYHILKVHDRRKAKGQVEVRQILVQLQKAKGEVGRAEAKKKLNKVLAELKGGAKFTDLVEKYSDDVYSKPDKGLLPKFSVGEMVPAFSEAAFALKKEGEVSDVVETDYGFHIIKLVKKYPVQEFDSVKSLLKSKIARDARSEVAREVFLNGVKKKNNFKEYPENWAMLQKEFISTLNPNGPFSANDYKGEDVALFEIKGHKFSSSDFLKYSEQVTRGRMMGPINAIFKTLYSNYVKKIVNDTEEQNLMDEKPEFRNLMSEYRDGILLFELMDRNVWGKASKDSAGLAKYHEKIKSKYMWNPGFRGARYMFKKEETAKTAVKLMKKGMTAQEILDSLNTKEDALAARVQRGFYTFENIHNFKSSEVVKGKPTEIRKSDNGSYIVLLAKDVYNEKSPKTLEEARGYVVAEYQDYLENKWNKKLREKYPVKVSDKVLKSLVK